MRAALHRAAVRCARSVLHAGVHRPGLAAAPGADLEQGLARPLPFRLSLPARDVLVRLQARAWTPWARRRALVRREPPGVDHRRAASRGIALASDREAGRAARDVSALLLAAGRRRPR